MGFAARVDLPGMARMFRARGDLRLRRRGAQPKLSGLCPPNS